MVYVMKKLIYLYNPVEKKFQHTKIKKKKSSTLDREREREREKERTASVKFYRFLS